MQTREQLIARIVGGMPDAHGRFLLSFQNGEPQWRLLEVVPANALPAVRWRISYLACLPQVGRQEQVAALKAALAGT